MAPNNIEGKMDQGHTGLPAEELLALNVLLERLDGDSEFAQEILVDSVEEIAAFIAGLKSQCAMQNAQELCHTAHTLKGMSGNIGALALRDLAYQIETCARAHDIEGVRQLIPTLEDIAARTLNQIRGTNLCATKPF
jgi:HPt (histidine-containing phosphotransfer) domain-containing protein